jgi:hypothetical protein
MAEVPELQTDLIPSNLPRLGRGRHLPGSPEMCAMEAAAWLSGERWSDRPASVHPAVAAVARWVNDSVSDRERQALWPLILASLGTSRNGLRLRIGLRVDAIRSRLQVTQHSGPRSAWEAVLASYSRRTSSQIVPTLVEATP